MITPMYKFGLVMWDNVRNAPYHDLFLCMGDHGLFCMVKWEEL